MGINKFINNIDETPLHSSGYAKVGQKNQIGAYSPQSFSQRLHIEKNRSAVGGYHHSMIANGHHRNSHYNRVDVVTPPVRPSTEVSAARTTTGSSFNSRRTGGLISDVTRPSPRQNFAEPPSRGFNPYK